MRLLRVPATALLAAALCAGCSARVPDAAGSRGSAATTAAADPHRPFDPATLPFTVAFHGIETRLPTLAAFVMPGERLHVHVREGGADLHAIAAGGLLRRHGPGAAAWTWTAPREPGDHDIRIRRIRRTGDGASGAEATVRVFVLRPWDGSPRLGETRIGRYDVDPKDGDPAYLRPRGFVEVTPANRDLAVSPHFRLGQFLCKDDAPWPRIVALQTSLLVKLEMLLAGLARRGLPASTLHVMSGYRTPAYNAAIGNPTTASRHLYGDAADVFLDRDGDDLQDDLDGDGRSTIEDARVLYEIAEEAVDGRVPEALTGGLALYGPTPAHGPFVHVDARGRRARW